MYNPGFDIKIYHDPPGFGYGNGVFGPEPEIRKLDDIRQSLRDPSCDGPEIVYSIVMDIGKEKDRHELSGRKMLFGAVTYSAGRLGEEPVRSQGHIHRISAHSGWSPPEVYEIWSGSAIILMQESAGDNPGRCFAVKAEPGNVVIVPPGWAHATISADPVLPLTFGAWCDREYGFEYDKVRAHQGLAFYPLLDRDNNIHWHRNGNYNAEELEVKLPEKYDRIGLEQDIPVYTQFERDPGRFQFVSKPYLLKEWWVDFIP